MYAVESTSTPSRSKSMARHSKRFMARKDCPQFSIRLEHMIEDSLPIQVELRAGWTADGEAVAANVMEFGRLLRRAGLDVDPGQTTTFVRALGLLGLDDRRDVRVA